MSELEAELPSVHSHRLRSVPESASADGLRRHSFQAPSRSLPGNVEMSDVRMQERQRSGAGASGGGPAGHSNGAATPPFVNSAHASASELTVVESSPATLGSLKLMQPVADVSMGALREAQLAGEGAERTEPAVAVARPAFTGGAEQRANGAPTAARSRDGGGGGDAAAAEVASGGVAEVTGGAAMQLAEEVTGVTPESPRRAAELLQAASVRAWPLYSDVDDMDDVRYTCLEFTPPLAVIQLCLTPACTALCSYARSESQPSCISSCCGTAAKTRSRPQVVSHVRAVQDEACRIFAVGFSAGSNCLTKYVGDKGAGCQLAAAVSVANAFDIKRGLAYVRKHARLLDRCASLCYTFIGLVCVRKHARLLDQDYFIPARWGKRSRMRAHARTPGWLVRLGAFVPLADTAYAPC